MSSTVTVSFYRGGRLNPADLLVRADTRRAGQEWADVPCHCAVIIGDTLYEFVASGWHARLATPKDRLWSYEVSLPSVDDAQYFAEACGKTGRNRYNWLTIAVIAAARLVPGRWFRGCHTRYTRICAWFAEVTLLRGFWQEPLWAARQYLPLSPNDVLWAVRETLK